VLALTRVEGSAGGLDALVLASPADLKAGVVEVLVASGQQLPTAPGSTATIASLKSPVQDEVLWTPAPSDASLPAPIAPAPSADAGAP
jgi:hypothetical protein